ncbi:hypothetical protein BRADI_2g13205v3 [Brachypodium distachyon]|uniref:Secreted peptide n=1 Tax=Brachypodium distachyon TaxID=15368 RepID=A0A2K2D8A1_BRADI|nr:hypothetical protein BRADI_2g13205v3 [Brachypodium distachyon]
MHYLSLLLAFLSLLVSLARLFCRHHCGPCARLPKLLPLPARFRHDRPPPAMLATGRGGKKKGSKLISSVTVMITVYCLFSFQISIAVMITFCSFFLFFTKRPMLQIPRRRTETIYKGR